MKISHKWLQTYFKKPLPSSEEIAELLTFHIFEVEGIEKKSDDDVLDVKVLPDRASYCLSYEGIARELSALLQNNEFVPRNIPELDFSSDISPSNPSIKTAGALRHAELQILNLSVSRSPEWLRTYLENIGQRSINLVVDLTNFVMFDLGQPMHVFDAQKLSGDICIRNASEGEAIELLGNDKAIQLDSSVMVLADNESALDIAGIKGGKKAEMGTSSKHLIAVASNFDPICIRKTSTKLKIKTDASKRFENGVSENLPEVAMRYFVALLRKEDPDVIIGPLTVVGSNKLVEKKINVNSLFISQKLGKDISGDIILELLNKAFIPARRVGEGIEVTVPSYRNDLNIPEDVVDEVGRLYGYENVTGVMPEIKSHTTLNNGISYRNIAKNFLVQNGFSEIQTYALASEGETEIQNPLSEDKKFLRTNLSQGIGEKLKNNIYYADLLGLSKIKVFEFGRVWKEGREFMSFAVAIAYKKAKKGESAETELHEVLNKLFEKFGINQNIEIKNGIAEFDFEKIITSLPKSPKEESIPVLKELVKYKPYSVYPFMVRDVAVFVTGGKENENEVWKVIERNASDLLVRHELFDVFEKKSESGEVEKTSFGFRLVFQSYDKTLTDEEINRIMDKIYDALKSQGWLVR